MKVIFLSYGVANDYLAYAVLEMIKKEMRKFMSGEGIQIVNNYNNEEYSETVPKEVDIQLVSNVLATLESYNYSLTLLRQDPSYPKRLTGIIIVFEENVKQIIQLIRSNDKLTEVIIEVFTLEQSINNTENPFNMPVNVFAEYMLNKYAYNFYTEIINDPESTPEEIDEATNKRNEVAVKNQNIRSLYGILSDDYSYDMLVQFLLNPLNMTENDFIKYVLNKKIYKLDSEGYVISQEDLDRAYSENIELREIYLINDDIYSYEVLKQYLPNPLGMTSEDFLSYYNIKKDNVILLEQIDELILNGAPQSEITDIRQQIYLAEQPYRDNYFIMTGVDNEYNVICPEDMNYEDMKNIAEQGLLNIMDKLLFKINVSLNYNMGSLNGVNSKINFGEV
jgi:hypothetical protein